jgi:hypothetical protein
VPPFSEWHEMPCIVDLPILGLTWRVSVDLDLHGPLDEKQGPYYAS